MMLRTDTSMSLTESHVKASVATDMHTFQKGLSRGRSQTSGRARGPTLANISTIKAVRKYQGKAGAESVGGQGISGGGRVRLPSRNSPQCLHLMAAS